MALKSKLEEVERYQCIMSKNGQTHLKNLATFAARFLKCVWPFWDITHWRVNDHNVLASMTSM